MSDSSHRAFDPSRRFSAVIMQQGRISLDADLNEQTAILLARQRTATRDVVGASGAPRRDPGFAVSVSGGGLTIGAGRMYVDGILVTNDAPVVVERPPDGYFIYLDVHERHVTALEDDELREPALAGPDTATRQQVAWRVEAVDPTNRERCHDHHRPRLRVRGGYDGAENKLYRVEIHAGGAGEGDARFKWSRDNGSAMPLVRAFGPELAAIAKGPGSDERTVVPGEWSELERGVEVSFDDCGGEYRSGDYWVFPPRDGEHATTGVVHHCALLAEMTDRDVTDRRRLFGEAS